jgi:non-heme chloroperoxidase
MASSAKHVIFVHGLWLHASSWDRWIELFQNAGYEAEAPAWPGESGTVEESREHPELIANRDLNEITECFANVIRDRKIKPILVGHSFGGLVAEKLLGNGLAAAAIAISPTQMKGIHRLPAVQFKNVLPFLAKPGNVRRAVCLSKLQFRHTFANAIPADEADKLYDEYTIPAPAKPLFQAALANVVLHSATKINTKADRGPLLIVGADKDSTVPATTSRDVFHMYDAAQTVNEYKEFPNRDHALVIERGWREVADYTLDWLRRHESEVMA